MAAQAADPVVAAAQAWAVDHCQHESSVAQMVAISGLAERTCKGRFAQAAGMGPLDDVHHVHPKQAKQMLESGDTSIESIANFRIV
jgi:transcriptional regulator GlxA family with amidase domain